MPATPTLNAKKAPGTTTGVRTDALGRRYMYKAGVRGRVALNLSEPQKKALAKKGLKNPGDKIRMKGSELKSLGIHLGESPHIDRMLSSHKKWRDTNSSDVSGRLAKLLSNGRGEWLKSGNTNEHRAFAAIVLGTILGKGVNKNAQNKSGITVTFNPGGRQNGFLAIKGKDGQEIGRVEFGDITKIQDKHIADFRKQFSALTAKAKQHKSVADEHKAMVEALNVRPESTPKVTHTFKTSKGSTYKFHEGGSTTRNKSDHSGALSLHEKSDQGEKKRSARTIFVPKDVATHLSGAGLSDVGGKGHHLVIQGNKATLVSWNKKENKWGATASGRNIEFSTEPKVGMSPVEMWDKHDKIGGAEAYSNQHAGNEITELSAAERLTGGKDDNKPDSSFNKKALAKGASDPAKQKEIAKVAPDKLEKVEKKNVATETPSPVSKVADSKAVKAVKPVAVKTPKPVKLGKGGVIKKVEQVATQLAMGGRGLHPLAHALRTDHKEPLLKLSAAGHKRLIKHYNERLSAGQSHDDAVKSTVEHMKAIVK